MQHKDARKADRTAPAADALVRLLWEAKVFLLADLPFKCRAKGLSL
jgi:hypothetical protein